MSSDGQTESDAYEPIVQYAQVGSKIKQLISLFSYIFFNKIIYYFAVSMATLLIIPFNFIGNLKLQEKFLRILPTKVRL